MKNGTFSRIRQAVICLCLLAAATAHAQTMAYAPDKETTTAPKLVGKSLAIAAYRVENTMKFKLHFENYAKSDVHVRLKNSQGKVLYDEMVWNADKYIRAFNLGNLPDGTYVLEVSNKQDKYVKTIRLGSGLPVKPKEKPIIQ